jgi:hypothetical protein
VVDNSVFFTDDAGVSFDDITGNLVSLAADFRTLEFLVGFPSNALVVGTSNGVFASLLTSLGTWFELGDDLPNAPVWDLDYSAIDDVLVAGTLGRGAWIIDNISDVVNGILTRNPPEVSLSFNYDPVWEDEGQATITVFLSEPQAEDVEVDLTFSGLAELLGVDKDYDLLGDFDPTLDPNTIRVTIPGGLGQDSITLTLIAHRDFKIEGDESVVVEITRVSGGDVLEADRFQRVTGTITDSDFAWTIEGYSFEDLNADGIWQGAPPEVELSPIGSLVIGPSDDGSTGPVDLGFTFNFFGQDYTSFYINNNGNVTFGSPLSNYQPGGFPTDPGLPIIAPFWADADTLYVLGRWSSLIQGRASGERRAGRLADMGYYSAHDDKLNTFTSHGDDPRRHCGL